MAKHVMGPQKDIGHVFTDWHPDTITHRFAAARDACGLSRDIRFHTLRHSAATQMLSAGIPLPVIQRILGHASISTTQIYAEVLDQVAHAEMAKMTW